MTWILLLRGINVGGRNILPMKELVRLLESLGLEDVKTYIQSGNVTCRSPGDASPTLGDDVAVAIESRYGFRPRILLLGADEWREAMEGNPFPEAEGDPKSLQLYFLASTPAAPDVEALTRLRSPTERFHLAGKVFYLHAPDGIGRSKLAAKVERHLGVPGTARNWRTIEKLWEMVSQ